MTILALAATLLFMLAGPSGRSGGPALATAGCGDLRASAEVKTRFPRPFASNYTRKLPVRVSSRLGKVRKWRVEAYTFSGFRLGKSKRDRRLRGTETAKVRLKQPMQPGGYTLVVKGKVRGCGEIETSEVIRLRSCLTQLPIKFSVRPGGSAADYSGFVSTAIKPRSRWAPVKRITSTLASFDGVVYGRATLPGGKRERLIGEQFLHHELTRDLDPGEYTVTVSGKAPQPRSCGEKTRSITLRFE